MDKIPAITQKYKLEHTSNPISDRYFCADPTSVVYNGRLYIYGSNDQQQFDAHTPKNSYEKIKQFVIFSTDDMTNWRFEGIIDVAKAAPWIFNSWAPSITSRVEEDGLTHFYLYFANGGAGVGVLTSTDPAGPFTSPLKGPLIWQNMPGLKDCPVPFDPGVVIDDNGTGWLAFGGAVAGGETAEYPDTTRIVRLGKDMISLDSEIASIPTPYFFEASELNFINGTFVYTFNTSWVERNEWHLEGEKPSTCSMCYMTSKTPLDESSWEYRGEYFPNPGNFGMGWGNNHTHFEKFGDKYYVIYHGRSLQTAMNVEGDFRSLCIDELPVDEKTLKITKTNGTAQGPASLKNVDAFQIHQAAEIFNSREINFVQNNESKLYGVRNLKDGAWVQVKNVSFDDGAKKVTVSAKGNGKVEIRKDYVVSEPIASFEVGASNLTDFTAKISDELNGTHNLIIVMSGNVTVDTWQFIR